MVFVTFSLNNVLGALNQILEMGSPNIFIELNKDINPNQPNKNIQILHCSIIDGFSLIRPNLQSMKDIESYLALLREWKKIVLHIIKTVLKFIDLFAEKKKDIKYIIQEQKQEEEKIYLAKKKKEQIDTHKICAIMLCDR